MSFAAPNNSAFLNSRRHGFDDEHGIYTRDEFQRDRDRIMHSRAFRRMMHKTQIFNANIGDHYRNRLTHTLEVSQIARSIGKNLSLNDELIEAIALGHDVGHTPFGHIGERTLHNIIMHGELNEIALIKQGFKHNFQSLRVLDELESRCNEYSGLNLTLAVREGILKHTSLKQDGVPVLYPGTNLDNIDLNKPSFTLEGQVVALADEIAQCTHDLEDAVRSKIITPDAIASDPFIKEIVEKYKITYDPRSKTPTYDTRSAVVKSMVGFFIEDACKTSQELVSHYVEKHSPQYTSVDDCINEKCISLSEEVEKDRKRIYKELIIKRIICSEAISISDSKSEYIIKQLFKAFHTHPKQLPDYILEKYCARKNIVFDRSALEDHVLVNDPEFVRAICDHISGMTDQFASREYHRLYVPEHI